MKKSMILSVILALILIVIILGFLFIEPKQKNLKFSSSDCKSSGDLKYLQGVRNVKWIDNSTMEILARVSINCVESIKSGNYNLDSDKILLDYKIRSSLFSARCICNHNLIYQISNLEKRDYQIILNGYENFNISCVGLDDENYGLQSCCETFTEDKELVIPSCKGNWTLKDNECSWKCGASSN